ncbi:MAG TPA: DNA polymerase III subunit chi, partial [Brevundimonas sp.]|nr:DNA polymerase III subunit chi [Brevundimonas sp.]
AARLAEALWTWRDDSFLANGHTSGPHPERQPILFTSGTDNVNQAQALFIVDGAGFEPTEDFQRCFILFDGQDEDALTAARARWKALKGTGADISYWRQTLEGRWEKAG